MALLKISAYHTTNACSRARHSSAADARRYIHRERLQERYRGKSQIQVYYDPDRPAESVLIPGLNIFNFTPLITSALFVLAGLLVIFSIFRDDVSVYFQRYFDL